MPIKPHNDPDPGGAPKSTIKAGAKAYRLLDVLLQGFPTDVAARLATEKRDAAARLEGERSRREEFERARRERERREHEDPRFVVTMVHGTFASKAGWIVPGEPFGRMLRDAEPTRIEPFVWSGRNTLQARTDAAQALRAHLQALLQRFPRAHHAVVAHSHGGNVALTALADEALAKRMLGVVTLGTPFLSARVIEDDPPLGLAEQLAAAIFSGVTVFAVGAALGHGRSWWTWGLLTAVAMGVFFALANWATSAYLDLTAEPAPPGTWSVTQLASHTHGELSHGRSHGDFQVFAFVASWLQERAAAVERQGSEPGDGPRPGASLDPAQPAADLRD